MRAGRPPTPKSAPCSSLPQTLRSRVRPPTNSPTPIAAAATASVVRTHPGWRWKNQRRSHQATYASGITASSGCSGDQ